MTSVQPTEKTARPRFVGRLIGIGRTVALTLFVIASLLTFPNAIPWMVACWLFWHTLLVARSRPGWLPLAACVAILLIKRVDWSPWLVAMATLMLVLCVLRVFLAQEPMAMEQFVGVAGHRGSMGRVDGHDV